MTKGRGCTAGLGSRSNVAQKAEVVGQIPGGRRNTVAGGGPPDLVARPPERRPSLRGTQRSNKWVDVGSSPTWWVCPPVA